VAPEEIRTPDPQIRSQRTVNRQVRARVAMPRPSHLFLLAFVFNPLICRRHLPPHPVGARAKAAAATDSAALVPWRLHDLRRTGASTLARLGFDTIAIDKLLAHQPTKLRGVAAIYQRYDFADERARTLGAWAEHVLTSNPGERERPLDNAMLVVGGAGRRSIRSRP
jgi:integrase